MHLPFAKYSGCGNDFILIDNRQQTFPFDCSFLIKKLCQRRVGIGADGIILLENSAKADFCMRIFNADGSEAAMCGNGIRCLGRFIENLGYSKKSFTIQVCERLYPLQLEGSNIRVDMGPPTCVRWSLQLPLNATQEESLTVDYLDTGVPHVVLFTHDLDSICTIGPKIRYHPHLAPEGANVNLASLNAQRNISFRTYERGVEEETLACGTGAAAVAVAAAKKFDLANPIILETRSGEQLLIDLTYHNNRIENIRMRGPAVLVYKGEVLLPDESIFNKRSPDSLTCSLSQQSPIETKRFFR